MSRGRQVGYARVQGTVRGPITLRQMRDQAVARQKRKLIRTLTLARQREAFNAWREHTADVLTLGPQRRKAERIKQRVQHPVRVRQDNAAAGKPQARPGCVIRPKQYVGQKPKHGTSKRGHGYCAGCGLELELERGRIPEHEAGPPPFTECYSCGILLVHAFPRDGALRKAGGSYTQLACPRCEAEQERQSAQDGSTAEAWTDEEPDTSSTDTERSWY
jgi:hypothetical protein